MPTPQAYNRVVKELEEAAEERDAALEALREIYMMCGNPDPSDGEGTTPEEVADSVRKVIPEIIRSVPHTMPEHSPSCPRCEWEQLLTERPELFTEKGPQ